MENMTLTRPILLCLASAALFAAAVPASKTLLAGLGPFTLAGLLYLGAALAVLPGACRNVSRITVSRVNVLRVAGVALFGGIFAPVLMLLGLKFAPAASVSLWLNLEVVATALIASAYFGDHLDAYGWFGIALVALAGVLLAAPSAFGFAAAALVASACFCWAVDNNLTAVIDGLTPSQITLSKGLVGGTINVVLGFALGKSSFGTGTTAIGLGVGALSYGASLTLYIGASQELGAARAQALFGSAPLIGCVFSWLALGERARLEQIAAAIVMGIGCALLFSRHEHGHLHAASVHTHAHSHDDGHHLHDPQPPAARHSHEHTHEPIKHRHPHVPDLHHRHDHSSEEDN
jgi:drug/metabolite transporter (DMT)-like permease